MNEFAENADVLKARIKRGLINIQSAEDVKDVVNLLIKYNSDVEIVDDPDKTIFVKSALESLVDDGRVCLHDLYYKPALNALFLEYDADEAIRRVNPNFSEGASVANPFPSLG